MSSVLQIGDEREARLIARAASWCNADERCSSALLEELGFVGLDPRDPNTAQGRKRSTLNNDGSALQVCTTASRRGRSLRWLVDPASSEMRAARRFELAVLALERMARGVGDRSLGAMFLAHAHAILPPPSAAETELEGRVLWLATDMRRSSLGVYVSARHICKADRWSRTRDWLVGLGAAETATAWAPFDRACRVASVGIEGTSAATLRAKVYLRPTRPIDLAMLPRPEFVAAPMLAFLHAVLGDRPLPLGSLVPSFSVAIANGAAADVKLDVCAHCRRWSSREWSAVLRGLGRHLGIDVAADEFLEDAGVELAFVGLGIEAADEPRLSLYWKASA